MSVVVHIDTPVLTIEEYARRTGLTATAVTHKIQKGELPTLKTGLDPRKRERVMINMLALVKMAEHAAERFDHPSMPSKGG